MVANLHDFRRLQRFSELAERQDPNLVTSGYNRFRNIKTVITGFAEWRSKTVITKTVTNNRLRCPCMLKRL